jgi:hypothetical protein
MNVLLSFCIGVYHRFLLYRQRTQYLSQPKRARFALGLVAYHLYFQEYASLIKSPLNQVKLQIMTVVATPAPVLR